MLRLLRGKGDADFVVEFVCYLTGGRREGGFGFAEAGDGGGGGGRCLLGTAAKTRRRGLRGNEEGHHGDVRTWVNGGSV